MINKPLEIEETRKVEIEWISRQKNKYIISEKKEEEEKRESTSHGRIHRNKRSRSSSEKIYLYIDIYWKSGVLSDSMRGRHRRNQERI